MLKDSFECDGGQVSQSVLLRVKRGTEWVQEFCGRGKPLDCSPARVGQQSALLVDAQFQASRAGFYEFLNEHTRNQISARGCGNTQDRQKIKNACPVKMN